MNTATPAAQPEEWNQETLAAYLLSKGVTEAELLAATEARLNSTDLLGPVVDLLVKLKDQQQTHQNESSTTAAPPKKKPKNPTGSRLVPMDYEGLLGWLGPRMKDTNKLVSKPHLLADDDELRYTLQGRDNAMEKATTNLTTMYDSSIKHFTTRTKYPIPVCSAMSGIGKSRLLDEIVNQIDQTFNTLPPDRLALVLSYANGHSVTEEERTMGSEAGFSWRLLYAVFLDGNNSNSLWRAFWSSLPSNARDLKLEDALHAISKAKKRAPNTSMALFVGIDEYQLVPKTSSEGAESPLTPLLNALLDAMIGAPSGLVILPMFAGTDWDKISLAASASSDAAANVTTERLPMTLLTPEATRRAVQGRDGTEILLVRELFCRHLFFLGGVPRPCTEYAEQCLQWQLANPTKTGDDVSVKLSAFFQEKHDKFFTGVYKKAPEDGGAGFSLRELIWLVAYSVCGGTVSPDDKPFENLEGSQRSHLSFKRLRDGSVCVLGVDGRLDLPYCFFYYLSQVDSQKYNDAKFPEAEKAFMQVLRFLGNMVDHNVFHPGNSPWQQWELFGTCFSALRINALLVTSPSGEPVRMSRIFDGAKTKLKEDFMITLRPMTCALTKDRLTGSSKATMRLENEVEEVDWISKGKVVVNGDNGKGVDVFYALELVQPPGKYVLVADQRKRVQGCLDVENTIKNARITPGRCLKEAGIEQVVVAMFSMFTCTTLDRLPQNSIAVTYQQHKAYHGALHLHPAASFCVRVNDDGVTALSGLFAAKFQDGAKAIIATRDANSINSFKDLTKGLGSLAGDLWSDAEDLCIFSR